MMDNLDDVELHHRRRLQLRMDLTRLGSWAENWQMIFNVEKCKVMNIGFKNRKEDYALNGIPQRREGFGSYHLSRSQGG